MRVQIRHCSVVHQIEASGACLISTSQGIVVALLIQAEAVPVVDNVS